MNEKPEELVLSRIESGIGHITINRPKYLNAFNLDLAKRFISILEDYEKNKTVRAIVIRGAGRVFSAGGDVKEMMNDVRSPLAAFHRLILHLRRIPKPVLTAVHGVVAGFAFNLMLACDLRIAEEGTRFTQAFVKIGLSPDGGGTYFLPRLVGHARACELTMLPTEIDANTALDWGLVNWVVPTDAFDDQVKKTAEDLVRGPAMAIGRAKVLLNQTHDHSLADQMEAERLAQIENAASEDFGEGLSAFSEKRRPNFHNCQETKRE
jgi:2-(1,2-epoxy-1,2-dihydrophenyl)acetyl-CoA isomerase